MKKAHRCHGISRRSFLKVTASVAGLCLAHRLTGGTGLGLANTKPKVVSVRNSLATNWDHVSGYYWDYIDQEAVNKMVAMGVMTLTGKSTVSEAWSALVPYQAGESIAIKVNFNNTTAAYQIDNDMDALPETVNAVIEGLKTIGVPGEKIWITDPSRVIPDRFRNRIIDPNVLLFSSVGTFSGNYIQTDYVSIESPDASLTTYPADDIVRPAQVFVDADHLINIPLLKGHGYGQMTLGMKNHYGSVIFKNYPSANQWTERQRLHPYIYPNSSDPPKNTLADIGNNYHIRRKTRLILGDGLFGHSRNYGGPPGIWSIFGNDDPKILFFGVDPIAADSVMYDYIQEEENTSVDHKSLHYGEELGLGVHDHWQSFETKQYFLIDYLHIDLDNPNRSDLDKIIKFYKGGPPVTQDDVKEMIRKYMGS